MERELCENSELGGPYFRVTFRLERVAEQPEENATEQKIMELIRAGAAEGGVSTQQLSGQVGISDRSMRDRLAKLIKAGKIVAIGKSAYDPNKRYLPVKRND